MFFRKRMQKRRKAMDEIAYLQELKMHMDKERLSEGLLAYKMCKACPQKDKTKLLETELDRLINTRKAEDMPKCLEYMIQLRDTLDTKISEIQQQERK